MPPVQIQEAGSVGDIVDKESTVATSIEAFGEGVESLLACLRPDTKLSKPTRLSLQEG
jgi:hypothetical protein